MPKKKKLIAVRITWQIASCINLYNLGEKDIHKMNCYITSYFVWITFSSMTITVITSHSDTSITKSHNNTQLHKWSVACSQVNLIFLIRWSKPVRQVLHKLIKAFHLHPEEFSLPALHECCSFLCHVLLQLEVSGVNFWCDLMLQISLYCFRFSCHQFKGSCPRFLVQEYCMFHKSVASLILADIRLLLACMHCVISRTSDLVIDIS